MVAVIQRRRPPLLATPFLSAPTPPAHIGRSERPHWQEVTAELNPRRRLRLRAVSTIWRLMAVSPPGPDRKSERR